MSNSRLLLWLFLFGFAFTQAPDYFSNQHQYFVHGLAQGGLGTLNEDWLANTLDPTPLFSKAVAFGYRNIGEISFLAVFFLLAMVYFAGLIRIGRDLLPEGHTPKQTTLLCLILLVVHCALLRVASVKVFGVDYPWFFQSGIAGQYLLGSFLQPSAFGVFLLLSLTAFVRERWLLACLFCCLPAIVHATYLLPAAFLTVGYQTSLLVKGRWRTALGIGLANLLLVLPVVIYSWQTFAPTTAGDFGEAERILAEVRIPHHAKVGRWFDAVVGLQLLWIALGTICLRRTAYFVPILTASLFCLLLSLVQFATGSYSLALLFPWRVAALLVPVATVAIAARAVGMTNGCPAKVAYPLALFAALGSLAIPYFQWGYRQNEAERPLLEFVRDHHAPGDIYLIPVRIPDPNAGAKGNISTTFVPPAVTNQKHLIAVDLQPFRLATGAPIYVDFKSIPYKDVEVEEWYRRLLQVKEWYARSDVGSKEWQAEVRQAGITHVVMPKSSKSDFGELKPAYEDEVYRVYRIER